MSAGSVEQRRSQNTKDEVKAGVSEGVRELLMDKELMKAFWQSGYDELVSHGQKGARDAVGAAFFKWLAGVLFAAAIWLIVKYGGSIK